MITNYDSRNSLEYYDIGSVYAFPVVPSLAGIALKASEEKDYGQLISALNDDKTISEMAPNYAGMVRVPGIVVDKERDGTSTRIVVIIRNNVGGQVEYQYKKYACGYTGAGTDGATLPLMSDYTFSASAIRPQLSTLPQTAPVVKTAVHTGPVEKNAKASAHTGPVEKTDTSAKHTGPVEKVETASTHTGPIEKVESNSKHTGPVEKM